MNAATPAQQALDIITRHPDWCYRTFQFYHSELFEVPTAERVLADSRPHCGYDCDAGCPVSGRVENDGRHTR